MKKNKKTYSREFKIEAVKLSHTSDKNVEAVAGSLGISKSTLRRWRGEFRADPDQAFPGKGNLKERDTEVAQLKKELRQAQMENEILKKPWPSSRRQNDEI